MMMHNKAWGHGCNTSKAIRVLLIIGGVNWGLVGLGMFLGSDLNVINMILHKCMIESLGLSEKLQLPPPVALPFASPNTPKVDTPSRYIG